MSLKWIAAFSLISAPLLAVAAYFVWPHSEVAGLALAGSGIVLTLLGAAAALAVRFPPKPVPAAPLPPSRLTQRPRRNRAADRRIALAMYSLGVVVGLAALVATAITGDVRVIARGLGILAFSGTALVMTALRKPRFNLIHCLGLLEEWRLDEAVQELDHGRRARDPEARKLAAILGPFTTALRGDLSGYERAHASALEAGVDETSWVTLGNAVYAARRRDWATVLESLDCSLVGLDEQPQAIAEALRAWAQSPDGAPQSTLQPVVICGLAGLDGVARIWPELVEYLKRRPVASALN